MAADNRIPHSLTSVKLEKELVQEGFQNVEVQKINNQLWVHYENRVFRYEVEGLKTVLTIIAKNLPEGVSWVNVITQKLQIPIIATSFLVKDLRALKSKEISWITFVERLNVKQDITKNSRISKTKQFANSGNYRAEFVLTPTLGLRLGGFPDPVVHQIDLIATANLFLWKGAKIRLDGIVPISSELSIIGHERIRPGILAFEQTIKLPKDVFLQGTVGYFSRNRYGGNLGLRKYFLNGKIGLKAKVGYTGYASNPKISKREIAERGWKYTNINYADYLVGIDYWFAKWNTRATLEFGKGIIDGNLIRLEVLQHFGEVDIGFIAFKTQRGKNYGMKLTVPIFPKKYWKPKRITIRPARTFSYNYLATQVSTPDYNTGDQLTFIFRHLNPAFIKNQFLKEIFLTKR